MVAVVGLELRHVLSDEKSAHAIAGKVCQGVDKEEQAAQGRELVQQEEHLAPVGVERLGQVAAELVQEEPQERTRAGQVRGRDRDVEGDGPRVLDEIEDAEVARRGGVRNQRIPVEAQIGQGG